MKQRITFAITVAVLAGCAGTTPVAVPAALDPPAGEALALIVPARGVQIYECRARNDGNGGEWAFVAPDAELFDSRGNRLGRHGAGPMWEAQDGSRVVGTVRARADAPVAGAVPWLLLTAKSSGSDGTLSRVTSIQRVNTVGGAAPVAPCTREAFGTSMRIDYTADYYFFAAR